mmetsp:Transcript_22577/g.63386  ORF Transcript_22577/g.63386 Transcript_22577/m.63386 type:complete len:236 (-) Transcript_22577:24-731(-)|eukprot:CAMPEP_0119143130 /NCGR_PEP_ID=MMETSP1310-20130426/33836_1 /TAXON_ID=464262 /ORGANISM="Genus nov. species nov., Strain RCC2339" /LENGTH=235 /DNA_ID=CAMNT_0007134733 /DNA_START=62 /DNA_END=769 /DNA_ORIENTATION=-
MADEWQPGPAEPIKESEFEQFRKECTTDDGWTEAVNNEKCTVWTRKSKKSSVNVVKVQTRFPDINPETLYDIFHDHVYRKTWDDAMIDGYVVEMLSKTNEVGYYSAKVGMISNRDFVNIRGWKARPEENYWAIVNHSVTHPDVPEKKGFVRAWSVMSGYYINRYEDDKTVEGGGTIFTFMSCADPRGWIPKWVINSLYASFAPSSIDKMKNAALGYKEWKAKQDNPDDKPWLIEE